MCRFVANSSTGNASMEYDIAGDIWTTFLDEK